MSDAMDIFSGYIDKMNEVNTTPKETKTRDGKCKICDETFTYELKRGRAPSMCKSQMCAEKYRRLMRKPKPRVVRKHECCWPDCTNRITQKGKGRTIKWCEECRTRIKANQNAEYRSKTFRPVVRDQGKCCDCGEVLGTKTGRGKLTIRCAPCRLKKRNEVARVSAKKNYKTVVRTYQCMECKQEKEQEGRGKLRKTCPVCQTNKSKAGTVKPMTTKVEQESEIDPLWSGILASMKDDEQ